MALSNTGEFEVNILGSDLNAGYFNPSGASAGTDYSQSVTPILTLADVVTNGTTTVTSATGGFTAAMVRNGINIAGTIYEIVSRSDSNTVIVDRAASAASGQSARVGGALASPGKAAGAMTNGTRMWIKQGTYPIDLTATANTSGGRVSLGLGESGRPTIVRGYTTTRGDQTYPRPVLQVSTGSAGVYVVSSTGNHSSIENIVVDANAKAGNGINGGGTNLRVVRCHAKGGFAVGINTSAATLCSAYGCTSFPIFASIAFLCASHGNSFSGFTATGDGFRYNNCISANNTGATSDGFQFQAGAAAMNCTSYGNGRNGWTLQNESRGSTILSSVSYNNAAWGFNVGTTYGGLKLLNVATGANPSGAYNSSFITDTGNMALLTANPFDTSLIAALGADSTIEAIFAAFSPNNVSGGGALLRGLSAMAYADIGAVQHQESGGGGSFIGSSFIPRGALNYG